MITNWNIERPWGKDVMPYIFYLNPNNLDIHKLDTLQYDWVVDTIICINSYFIGDASMDCTLLSSTDTLTYVEGHKIPITHTKTIGIDSDFMYNVIKYWNQRDIDRYMLTDLYSVFKCVVIHDGDISSISRIIINNGKIVDFKHKTNIEYIPDDATDKLVERYYQELDNNFKNLIPIPQ